MSIIELHPHVDCRINRVDCWITKIG